MKLNPDGKTVAAMDVLVPKVGPGPGGAGAGRRARGPRVLQQLPARCRGGAGVVVARSRCCCRCCRCCCRCCRCCCCPSQARLPPCPRRHAARARAPHPGGRAHRRQPARGQPGGAGGEDQGAGHGAGGVRGLPGPAQVRGGCRAAAGELCGGPGAGWWSARQGWHKALSALRAAAARAAPSAPLSAPQPPSRLSQPRPHRTSQRRCPAAGTARCRTRALAWALSGSSCLPPAWRTSATSSPSRAGPATPPSERPGRWAVGSAALARRGSRRCKRRLLGSRLGSAPGCGNSWCCAGRCVQQCGREQAGRRVA
jgi:hypothetical protein